MDWLTTKILYGDGEADDTDALQAWMDGEAVITPDGQVVGPNDSLFGGIYRISRTVYCNRPFRIYNSTLYWTGERENYCMFDIGEKANVPQTAIRGCLFTDRMPEDHWPEIVE